jgi:hypothetical protein
MAGAIETTRSQRVIVRYKVLPEIYGTPEDNYSYIPEQIEIIEVKLKLFNLKSEKSRVVNITDTLTDSEIIDLEDEIVEKRITWKKQYLKT